ncbi:PREDICTED: uncharacterized protein LOC109176185 [Ipomoea nil]|uniref:uncharacterized protein LOC109176185 n=1 Tax=Ipomoea nil TaxID=35883 RepID=UPI000901C7E2|nr:PREDICTED: uncharacterized protein LOC109176185 [Ipomoea nil]
MAANTSGVSDPTAKNPERDGEHYEGDPLSDSPEWSNVLREISSESLQKQGPVIRRLCKLALTHYENSQPGETYEFVNLQKVLCGQVAGIMYSVTFCAKNLKNDVVETFEAVGYDLIGEDELKIETITLKY